MCPVLRLMVLVGVLLSAGPTAGAWYPQGPYHPAWLQYYGQGAWQIDSQSAAPASGAWYLRLLPWLSQLWHFNMFQQQQISQLKMQVTELKNQSSEQQKEIDELKPLLRKVMLLETIIGVNLTVDDTLTDFNESILERLSKVEEEQRSILGQQETFRQLHGHHNQSIQTLNEALTSLTDKVNVNSENITDLRTIQNERANHSDQLTNLFNAVESHNTTIGGPLDSEHTLVSFLEKLEDDLEKQTTILEEKNTSLQEIERRLEEYAVQLSDLNDTIPSITGSVDSVRTDLEGFKETEQAQAAFSVRCSNCAAINREEAIIYDEAQTNTDGAYSLTSGCFTAPRKGLYIFYTSLRSDDTSNITVGIYNGDSLLMEATADGADRAWNTGSALVTTQLNTSDAVCVKHVRGDTDFDSSSYTTFSGWLKDVTP